MTEKKEHQTNQLKGFDPASPVILLVDDNEINLQMLYQTLDGQGYGLLIARSGEDALRIAARAEKVIENSWLKSIVAFLNTDGGVLLIGVADAGDILGTEADRFDNDDKYLLHVNNRIREYIGLEFVSFINFQLVPVEEQKVLLVQCQPSPSPVFFKTGKDEEFYVRVGPGNRRLSTSEVLTYVTNRKAKG